MHEMTKFRENGSHQDDVQLENSLRFVVQAAPYAIVSIVQSDRVALVNRKAGASLGNRRDELFGLKVNRLIPARLRGEHTPHRAKFFERPEMYSIAKRIVERHGRRIGVESRPGGGTISNWTLRATSKARAAS